MRQLAEQASRLMRSVIFARCATLKRCSISRTPRAAPAAPEAATAPAQTGGPNEHHSIYVDNFCQYGVDHAICNDGLLKPATQTGCKRGHGRGSRAQPRGNRI